MWFHDAIMLSTSNAARLIRIRISAGLVLADSLPALAERQQIPGAEIVVAAHVDGVAVIGESLGVDEIVGQPGAGRQRESWCPARTSWQD